MASKHGEESGTTAFLLGVELRRYEHSGSKRHYAHRNGGHTYKSQRDNFSQFGCRSIEKISLAELEER